MDGGRPGGILGLCRLLDEHRSEAAADFRAIYGVSLWGVPIVEAFHLTRQLMRDPSSRLQAAAAGWGHPVSREWIVLSDLFDLQHVSKSKRKPKDYARPWDKQPARKGTAMSIGELRAKLANVEVAADGEGASESDGLPD